MESKHCVIKGVPGTALYVLLNTIYTDYYDSTSNLIWLSVSHGVDEVIPLDHPRRRKQTVQKLYHYRYSRTSMAQTGLGPCMKNSSSQG